MFIDERPICAEKHKCIFQDTHGRVSVCLALDSKSGPPYPNGKCKFYKATKDAKSGYRSNEYKEDELVWRAK